MPQSDPKLLVSTEWLADHLSAPDVKVLDASMLLPGDPRDAKATYAETHIPGAIFFDIDEMCQVCFRVSISILGAGLFATSLLKLGLYR